jgi:MFS family permease
MWQHRRVLAASLIGTAVEFYDFYIYATAASLVFGPLFFPSTTPAAQLMASYASFAVAFFARPLGAAVFGHYGDRIGRKSTLVVSLMLMGGSTLAIAFLPGYQAIGFWAPLLLCVMRFGQGFGLGGEWGGAALLATENAPPGWKSRFGMFPQLGAPVGFLFANGLFLLLGQFLDDAAFMQWGWRIPFLASAVLVVLGLWIRLKITETPEFAAILERQEEAHAPLIEVMRGHIGAILSGTFSTVACFAIFYITTAFALGYGTTKLGIGREHFLLLQLVAILFMAAGIVLAGWWADSRSPRWVLMAGCVISVPMGMAFGTLLGTGEDASILVAMATGLFAMGFVYGPLGAFLPSLFPVRLRYSGISFAFNMGGIFGGALAPIVATALVASWGIGAAGLYMAAAAGLSLLALIAGNGRRR